MASAELIGAYTGWSRVELSPQNCSKSSIWAPDKVPGRLRQKELSNLDDTHPRGLTMYFIHERISIRAAATKLFS